MHFSIVSASLQPFSGKTVTEGAANPPVSISDVTMITFAKEIMFTNLDHLFVQVLLYGREPKEIYKEGE